ncbi:MAG TPA: DcaP family trimeric outer membrane transporter, partial [Thermoanaerobaculia bacterium]|nr:DcaP family trimeric outer membrane transporter [Thermoanaerobaculia bacterium]
RNGMEYGGRRNSVRVAAAAGWRVAVGDYLRIAARAGLAACLIAIVAGPIRAEPAEATKAAQAKIKQKDPFTAEQRRELERIVEEARRALVKEREEVEAALARLREEREALEREKAEVEAKKAAVEQQAAKVEALAKEIERQRIRLDELEQSFPTQALPSQELADRLAKLEESSKQKPDLPPEVVSAGDFPGSIRIPGSPAAIKFGGSVWVSAVSTLDSLGSDDRFLTYSIPVAGDPSAEKGPRTSFWANPSRLNFEARTKGPGDRTIRAFVEGDFAGSSNGFRLRHAYFQVGGLLAGQTWSTFSDPDADTGDIDFEGVNAENVKRQAQFRYTRRVSPVLRLAASVEFPNASLTDTNGKTVQSVNQVPDFVVRGTWNPSAASRLQGAAVLRSIRGESSSRPNEIQHATGWGLSASGTASQLPWARGDAVTFQASGGEGIARFINDLDSATGQDGAFDPANGDLVLLRQWGWFGSYLHRWSGKAGEPGDLRSSFIWGAVRVDNLEFQQTNAYRRTHRLSLNLVWTPFRSGEVGVEYIWGERVDKNGASGEARQLQVRARYVF